HGLTATGGRGPSLISAKLLRGSTDEEIKKIIQNGVPGTTMPSFENIEKDDLESLVGFIRHLAGSDVKSAPVTGDAVAGRKVYERSGCSGCHRVGNEGSIYGPDLTRVGGGRSSEYIHESLVEPSADIPQDYEGVTVVTQDGKRITGMRVNEDTFTLQLRSQNQKFLLFDKSKLKEVIHESKSLMPSYKSMPPKDLQNLLAYLDSLRSERTAGTDIKKAKGIQ
ncbi:MAG: c-type cytochrome, partial [Acidobacteriota bacterium]|nr:c-type cytochrome [Acidobacteriota bacterium]